MKLTTARKTTWYYPDGGKGSGVCLEFTDGDKKVDKLIKVSVTSKPTHIASEVRYLVLKKSREAERDFAYMKYGDDWKDHVPQGMFWSSNATKDEFDIVHKAISIMTNICG